jgi:hypothetical protein
VPGDHAWDAQWARLLARRRVSVVMDSDHAGRVAARQIAADVRAAGVHGAVIGLAPGRHDGYDLTAWLSERLDWPVHTIRAALGGRGAKASAAA